MLLQTKIDLPRLGDARDERRLLPAEDANHVTESSDKHLRHLCSAVVTRTEVELTNPVLAHRSLFQFVVSDTFVLREHHPISFTHEREPLRVLRARSKVLAVALVLYAVLDERIEYGFAVVKIFVEIKNEVFRRR